MSTDSSDGPWQETPPPASEFRWSWSPARLADLPAVRREFRAYASDLLAGRPGARNAVEDAVLALDELATNALRHGRTPVTVTVGSLESGLMLVVNDLAGDTPPRSRLDGHDVTGGHGLQIVASAARGSGWCRANAGKSVWAFVPLGL